MSDKFQKAKKILDEISPSFCPAKWLQVTLHLSNGHNHSCHHPDTHKALVDEVKKDPSALHNTKYKKEIRKQMLKGERPKECEYCWKMESADTNVISDRYIKASDEWAFDRIAELRELEGDESVHPSYLEVSFDNTCNLRCMYCGPHISSALEWEYSRFGNYRFMETLEQIKGKGKFASDAEKEIYTKAFWKWFPDLIKELKVLRVTGGEPLLSGNTFKLLRELNNYDCSNLELSINSNLAVSEAPFQKFVNQIKEIKQKEIKKLSLYVSVDTFGVQAEYIRFGLDYDQFMERVELLLNETVCPVVFMATYSLLAAPSFSKLISAVSELKKKYGEDRVTIDVSMIHYPHFITPAIADNTVADMAKKSLELMIECNFSEYETSKFKRITSVINAVSEVDSDVIRSRRDFVNFIPIYDKRKGTSFDKTFKELIEMKNRWKSEYGEEK